MSNAGAHRRKGKIRRKEVLKLNNSLFVIERARAEDAAALLDYLKIVGGETENLSFGAVSVAYTYADSSKYFLQEAEKELAGYERVEFEMLNLEEGMDKQQMSLHSYDIVISVNALQQMALSLLLRNKEKQVNRSLN